jgi:hypothetical protein
MHQTVIKLVAETKYDVVGYILFKCISICTFVAFPVRYEQNEIANFFTESRVFHKHGHK